ncbi:MAG: phosphotransferase family protein [Bacteroidota bacterium]
MSKDSIDQPTDVRSGESLDEQKVQEYLINVVHPGDELISIAQFPSGFSNLTYLLKTKQNEYVLRKPPIGANIKSAHDMGREYRVLSLLKPHFSFVPEPIAYEESGEVLGTPFYLMERVQGIILRNKAPKGIDLDEQLMRTISENTIKQLAELHQIDLQKSGLVDFGKPEGYVERQVSGWQKRYFKAKTDEVEGMESAFEWLVANLPTDDSAAFIHNDFKYDNIVLDPADPRKIKAILDWEMATVGDPLMDLGTTLAYWAEAKDSDALKPFNLTWTPGNLTREEVVETYFQQRGTSTKDVVFYYVFGALKVGVICQQIYARYAQGITRDPRFKQLIWVTRACAANAQKAINFNRISNLY